MHKLSTRLLSLLLGIMLIVSMSFTAFAAEEDEYQSDGSQSFGPYSFTSLYSGDIYYSELSPIAKKLYDGLKTAMTNPRNSWQAIELPKSSATATDFNDETLVKAYSALRSEWPELFQWVDLSFSIAVESNNTTWRISYFSGVQAEYQGDMNVYDSPNGNGSFTRYKYWDIVPSTVNSQQKKAEAKAAEVLRGATGDDYDKVVYFNNWIIDHTEYDFDALEEDPTIYDNTFHMAGVFNDGLAVCEGYAKAFKYLCDKSGIECLYISGNLVMNEDGDLGAHAWNYVKLDGAWYIVDATNNDNPEPDRNVALCIGSNDWFAQLLLPDGAYDYENKVFIDTPGVVLNGDNYGDRAKSLTFTAPVKTEYFAGDVLDLAGGKVTVNRYNGKTDTLDMTADMLTGLDMTKVGVQNVTVSYSGKTAANKLTITVKNAPLTATIHDAVVNYPLGISSLDLSKGYAMVTYADKTITRPKLNDTEKVAVNLPIGVSGLEVGTYTVSVTILGDKPLTTSYQIGVGLEDPLPELPPEPPKPNGDGGSSGGGSRGGLTSRTPGALTPDKAISELSKLDPKSPPAGSKTVTIGGKNIITLPMAITDSGLVAIDTITQLGALPSGVGVIINQGSGLPEILIPSGFKFIKEPGQFALSLKVTNELTTDAKTAVAKELEAAKRTQIFAGNLGGTTVSKFPVPFTIMVPVKLAEGTTVTVQMVNPVTGKQLSTLTVKVVGGMISFPTSTTGGIVISTAK